MTRFRFRQGKVAGKSTTVGIPVVERVVSRNVNDDRWTRRPHSARHLPIARLAVRYAQDDRCGQVPDVDAQFQSARGKNAQARAIAQVFEYRPACGECEIRHESPKCSGQVVASLMDELFGPVFGGQVSLPPRPMKNDRLVGVGFVRFPRLRPCEQRPYQIEHDRATPGTIFDDRRRPTKMDTFRVLRSIRIDHLDLASVSDDLPSQFVRIGNGRRAADELR